ncbi:MAG: hypothetical protein ABWZ40_12410 [Caulobacterales bacterium]
MSDCIDQGFKSPSSLKATPKTRLSRRSIAILLAVAVIVPIGVVRLLDKQETVFGAPGETIVGPNRVKWEISGLPRVGKGIAQDDASALWLGATQSIHAGVCAGVNQGRVVIAEAPEGLKQALGIYVVSCVPDADGQVRKYWFKRAGNGVSPCADLDSCKKNT